MSKSVESISVSLYFVVEHQVSNVSGRLGPPEGGNLRGIEVNLLRDGLSVQGLDKVQLDAGADFQWATGLKCVRISWEVCRLSILF